MHELAAVQANLERFPIENIHGEAAWDVGDDDPEHISRDGRGGLNTWRLLALDRISSETFIKSKNAKQLFL